MLPSMSRFTDAFRTLVGSKALDHSRDAVPVPNLFGPVGIGRRIANLAAGRHSEAYGGKEAIDWVMDCVNLYADTIAHADYHFEKDGTTLVRNPRAPENRGKGLSTAPQDLIDLFKIPNRNSDYTELWQLSVIDYLLVGEFFWLKNQINPLGQPLELFRLNPRYVEVKPGRVAPEAYIYRAPGTEEQTYSPDEIVHVKRANPHSPWRGLGVIAGNPRLYDISLSLDDSIAGYYERGTRLTGVLESERSVPDTTWQRIKREFTNLYSGRANAYGVAFLSRGLKFKPISSTAVQADFDPAQDKIRDRIAAAFGAPTPLLGDVGGSTDRQAVREAQRIFDNKKMRPLMDTLQSRVSLQLTQAWDVDFVIDYQYTMPIEDKLDLASNMALLPVTADELRDQIDLPPLTGANAKFADKLMVEPGAKPPGSGGPLPPKVGGGAPYPAGAAGRGGQPTTADAQKALERLVRRMEATAQDFKTAEDGR